MPFKPAAVALVVAALCGIGSAVAAPPPDPATAFFSARPGPAPDPATQPADAAAAVALATRFHAAGNPSAAATWLLQADTLGSARASYLLGLIYAHGDGVPQDPALADYFLGKAAPHEPAAACVLAQRLLDAEFDPDASPEAVRTDAARAEALLRGAAQSGWADAQYRLGILLLGQGRRADALAQLRASAAQGDLAAQERLRTAGD